MFRHRGSVQSGCAECGTEAVAYFFTFFSSTSFFCLFAFVVCASPCRSCRLRAQSTCVVKLLSPWRRRRLQAA